MKVGISRHTDFFLHRNGPGHPERPERLHAVDKALGRLAGEDLEPLTVRPATHAELSRVHREEYLVRLQATRDRELTVFDADTSATSLSFDVALLAAGAATEAVTTAIEGTFTRSFVFCRPPGHHAEADRAMGFCLINNAAVAATAAIEKGVGRVAIVDWDVHHGNGTQHIFWSRRDVFYASLHQYPHYPGTGAAREIGEGHGEGYTLNIPLHAGAGDETYLDAVDGQVLPALREYRPELIIVSAGFDGHRRDPLAGMNLSDDGYRQMTQRLVDLAQSTASGRIVHLLEGGYDLEALAGGVEAVMRVLTEADSAPSG